MFALLCPELSVDFGLAREYKLEGRREPFLVSFGVSEDEGGSPKLGTLRPEIRNWHWEIPLPWGTGPRPLPRESAQAWECHAPTAV